MVRVLLLTAGTAGLLFTSWLDNPENYEHTALLPATTAAATTSTTGADVVGPPEAPVTAPTTSTTVTTTARQDAGTVPDTTAVILSGAKCPELSGFAVHWFTVDELATVDAIAWQESRCQADAVSPTRDYGLMQINWATWGPMVTELGYTRDDLLNPVVNLMVASLVSQEAERIGWCKWQPWYMSGNWC